MLVNFFGARGSGKTNVIKGTIPKCQGPRIVLDLFGNFSPGGDYHLKDAFQTNKNSEMIEFVKGYKDSEEETRTVVLLAESDPTLALEYASAALWEKKGGTLIADEVDGFESKDAVQFDRLVRYGRNRNIDLVTGCRRPYEISRNITAGANKIFIFETHENRDIEYFKKSVLGDRAEDLVKLPKYHGLFLDYDKKGTGIFKTDINGNIYILSFESFENQNSLILNRG